MKSTEGLISLIGLGEDAAEDRGVENIVLARRAVDVVQEVDLLDVDVRPEEMRQAVGLTVRIGAAGAA